MRFRSEEQLLGMLYDGGMLTQQQLQVISGFSESKIQYCLKRIRKNESALVHTTPLPSWYGNRKAYSLTRDGIRYVYDMMGIEKRIRTAPEQQLAHYIGTNDVLVRAVERFGRKDVTWLCTREASEELKLIRKMHGANVFRGEGIRPDASITVTKGDVEVSAWVEFDNSTESTAALESKFQAYVTLAGEIGQNVLPILWVTTSERRRDYMSRLYEALKMTRSWGELPKQYFFVEGQETDWLAHEIEKTG
jgi:Replication-relaxation